MIATTSSSTTGRQSRFADEEAIETFPLNLAFGVGQQHDVKAGSLMKKRLRHHWGVLLGSNGCVDVKAGSLMKKRLRRPCPGNLHHLFNGLSQSRFADEEAIETHAHGRTDAADRGGRVKAGSLMKKRLRPLTPAGSSPPSLVKAGSLMKKRLRQPTAKTSNQTYG